MKTVYFVIPVWYTSALVAVNPVSISGSLDPFGDYNETFNAGDTLTPHSFDIEVANTKYINSFFTTTFNGDDTTSGEWSVNGSTPLAVSNGDINNGDSAKFRTYDTIQDNLFTVQFTPDGGNAASIYSYGKIVLGTAFQWPKYNYGGNTRLSYNTRTVNTALYKTIDYNTYKTYTWQFGAYDDISQVTEMTEAIGNYINPIYMIEDNGDGTMTWQEAILNAGSITIDKDIYNIYTVSMELLIV